METTTTTTINRQIIDKYGRLVASAVRRVVGPCGEIEDIVQETWLSYFRHGHQVTDPKCLGGWLFQVATRHAIRTQTRAARSSPSDDVESVAGRFADTWVDRTDITDAMLRRERLDALRAAVNLLPERDRRLLDLLMDDGDLSYREISERTGVPMGSLGPTRQRLIGKLRAAAAIQRLADPADGHMAEPLARYAVAA